MWVLILFPYEPKGPSTVSFGTADLQSLSQCLCVLFEDGSDLLSGLFSYHMGNSIKHPRTHQLTKHAWVSSQFNDIVNRQIRQRKLIQKSKQLIGQRTRQEQSMNNTEEPAPQGRTQQFIYILRRKEKHCVDEDVHILGQRSEID